MKKSRRNFTLIEVLAVVGIIGVLALLGFGTYTFAMNSAKESSSRALIKRVEAALENCRTRFGYYPASGNYERIGVDLSSDGLVENVYFGGTASSNALPSTTSNNMLKEFLRVVDEESFKKYAEVSGYLEDAFGGAVYYKYPGNINKTGFDLIAPGADGKFGEGRSDTPGASMSRADFYSSDNEKICDDITNF